MSGRRRQTLALSRAWRLAGGWLAGGAAVWVMAGALFLGAGNDAGGQAWAAGPAAGATGVVSGTVRVANVTDAMFSVSWLTGDAVTGAVRYGTGPARMTNLALDDVAGARRTHHVTPGWTGGELLADTWYYYDILSGGAVDDNGGAHYIYATGPDLGYPAWGDTAVGRVVTATGAPVSNSIVYFSLQDADGLGSPGSSGPRSVMKAGPDWSLSTNSVREAGLGAYFNYVTTTDRIALAVQGEPDGRATDLFTASLGIYPMSRTITLTAGTLPEPAGPVVPPGASAPDLLVESIQWSTGSPVPGCSAAFTVTVRNIGDVAVAQPFRVALYLDHSRKPYWGERSNTNTWWLVSQTLAPSGTVTLSSLEPAPGAAAVSRLEAAGRHTVYAQADSYNDAVLEKNEQNNMSGPLLVDAEGACTRTLYFPVIWRQ